MISPTLMMENELDTDTDDDDDKDDTANIYEEVLNGENQDRQLHGRLSTTSSLYPGDYSRRPQYQVRYKHQHNLSKSIFSFESLSPNQWRKGCSAGPQNPPHQETCFYNKKFLIILLRIG